MAFPAFYFPIFDAAYLQNSLPADVVFLSEYIGPTRMQDTPPNFTEHFLQILPLTCQERKHFLNSVREYFDLHPKATSVKEVLQCCQMTAYTPALSYEEIQALQQITPKGTSVAANNSATNDSATRLPREILCSFHRMLLLALQHESLFFDAAQLVETIATKESLLQDFLHSSPGKSELPLNTATPKKNESVLSSDSEVLDPKSYHPENWQQILLALFPFLPENTYLLTDDKKITSFLRATLQPKRFNYSLPPNLGNDYKNHFCVVQAPLKEFLPQHLTRAIDIPILDASCKMLLPTANQHIQ